VDNGEWFIELLTTHNKKHKNYMEYSKLHGYNISRLTLGTVALGMNYGISNNEDKPDKAHSFGIISSALKAGINTLDTARGYGEAEQLIGDFLENQEINQPVNIVTKFRLSQDSLNNKEKVRAEIYSSVRSSLSLLKLKYIPICLLHMNRRLPLHDVLEILPSVFSDLKNDGLIDIAGVSVDHPDEAVSFLEHPVIEAMQVPLNIFDTRVIKNGSLDRMHKDGKIVFIRSIFLQGLFFMNPHSLKGNLTEAAKYIEVLQDIARRANMSIAQLAFSFVNNLQGISSIVFGAVNQDQVKQNTGLLETGVISDEIKELIQSGFDEVPEHIITPGQWSFI
jgi:aryl-alcohol dehydrogenase-like predicted oxidoreductase